MEIVGMIALSFAISSGLFIYHHFTTLFEAQMKVTNKILQNCQFKTVKEIDTEPFSDDDAEEAPPPDWLYDAHDDYLAAKKDEEE